MGQSWAAIRSGSRNSVDLGGNLMTGGPAGRRGGPGVVASAPEHPRGLPLRGRGKAAGSHRGPPLPRFETQVTAGNQEWLSAARNVPERIGKNPNQRGNPRYSDGIRILSWLYG